jgi:uncharacterized membrane protein YciS (DUF1049 family)
MREIRGVEALFFLFFILIFILFFILIFLYFSFFFLKKKVNLNLINKTIKKYEINVLIVKELNPIA